MTIPLLAFHGDPAIKAKYLDRVRMHRAADAIVKGQYWQDGKGCAVGCTLHSNRHADYETELGIPEALAYLEDDLFEAMPNEHAMAWPQRFLEAIPVGADLSLVPRRYLAWMLRDLLLIKDLAANVRAAVEAMAVLMERSLNADEPTPEEWSRAEAAAWDARSARAARAARAAWDAWDARSARAAWAARAAWDAARATRAHQHSEQLLRLLAAAPVSART